MSSKLQTGVAMMAMFLALMFGSGTKWVSADEQKKEGAGDVKERAVPRTGPGVLAPPKSAGLMVQGNQLKAAPGYVLEKGPNNTMSARRAGGGLGAGGTATCGCTGGTGNCDMGASGPIAVCSVSPSKPCNGTCEWNFPDASRGGVLMR